MAGRWFLLFVKVGEVGTDGGGGGLVVLGVVGTEASENVQSVLPVLSGMAVMLECVMDVGNAVVGESLVGGLPEVGRERERSVVVVEGHFRLVPNTESELAASVARCGSNRSAIDIT